MKFLSTRGKAFVENASQAIAKGLADDGGLFVPENFPDFSDKLVDMLDMDYAQRATEVIHSFLGEYDKQALLCACQKAYGRFEGQDAAPLVKIDDKKYILELFHGPTLAFKDLALTLLPYLLRAGADNSGIKDKILILVATSGDTGKAALEGFKNQQGIYINVFYPSEGVSDMQKRQMTTQDGDNVNVVAVKGNFDDCQTAVKKMFADKAYNAKLKEQGIVLSSANSINFGRLVPQIAYYFSAYLDLVNAGQITMGKKVDFTVPTGNFGNILAGYYAKKMGLPVGRLICASNMNNVLTEFFVSGNYDANREFFKTNSPSMDILISSNLERLIYEISGRDADLTEKRMASLKNTAKYEITAKEKAIIDKEFYAGYVDEHDCACTISDYFEEYGYVLDTHTAIAARTADEYAHVAKSKNNMVILSTASPYKFTQSVLKAVTGKSVADAFKAAQMLYNQTATPIPEQIEILKTLTPRFDKVVDKKAVQDAVDEFADSFQQRII